ncbi:MAG: hypothetical protein CMQ40_07340 [Gammaproteobacteria bacterium]|nr:hypothetical protein [Gammaproteobacteria bacterium]
MTRRSHLHQIKLEARARLKAALSSGLFANRETLYSRLVKKMLGINGVSVNEDPELEHPDRLQ